MISATITPGLAACAALTANLHSGRASSSPPPPTAADSVSFSDSPQIEVEPFASFRNETAPNYSKSSDLVFSRDSSDLAPINSEVLLELRKLRDKISHQEITIRNFEAIFSSCSFNQEVEINLGSVKVDHSCLHQKFIVTDDHLKSELQNSKSTHETIIQSKKDILPRISALFQTKELALMKAEAKQQELTLLVKSQIRTQEEQENKISFLNRLCSSKELELDQLFEQKNKETDILQDKLTTVNTLLERHQIFRMNLIQELDFRIDHESELSQRLATLQICMENLKINDQASRNEIKNVYKKFDGMRSEISALQSKIDNQTTEKTILLMSLKCLEEENLEQKTEIQRLSQLLSCYGKEIRATQIQKLRRNIKSQEEKEHIINKTSTDLVASA
ncbi:hypothetical protein HK096_002970, partial [Nowakowskiella sp. JEL0078]